MPGSPQPHEVLAVLFPLDVSEERREQLLRFLNQRERERFESFKFEDHRLRWGTSRGTLREILGALLGVAPSEVQFSYGAHGKPGIRDSALRFNLSHSQGQALLAVAQVEVGADVEWPRQRRNDDIARRFFSAGENERLFALPAEDREREFFRLWCCKEAFLKCTGEGLSRSTRSYEVELLGDRARLLWARGVDASRYSVFPIETGSPCRAAVVAEGVGLSLSVQRWPHA
jgi:4'-phosphopantetheinyl transferase